MQVHLGTDFFCGRWLSGNINLIDLHVTLKMMNLILLLKIKFLLN